MPPRLPGRAVPVTAARTPATPEATRGWRNFEPASARHPARLVTVVRAPASRPTPKPVSDPSNLLRRDIRRLGSLLGGTLAARRGRSCSNWSRACAGWCARTARPLCGCCPSSTPTPPRSWCGRSSTYFHLANVAEQVHRARGLAAVRARDGAWLAQAVDRIAAAEVPLGELGEELRRLAVRPVFTAHPTEAARRTVLGKLRDVARAARRARPDRRRPSRRSARGPPPGRAHRPALADRRAAHRAPRSGRRGPQRACTTSTSCTVDAVPDRAGGSWPASSAGSASSPRRAARPLRFGTWIGGDRDGNPNVTRRGHRAGARASSTSTASAARSHWSTSCATISRPRCASPA